MFERIFRPQIINTDIPGFKSPEQLRVLSKLVSKLHPFSNIVEVGACAGRATWTLSKNAPWFSKIYAIDTWADKNVFYGVGFNLEPEKQSTREYFLEQVHDRKNIIPIQEDASQVSIDFKIDFLFIDSDMGRGRNNNWPIWENLAPCLKKGALVVGANYLPESRPDEVLFADEMANKLGNLTHEHGIWWSFYNTPNEIKKRETREH